MEKAIPIVRLSLDARIPGNKASSKGSPEERAYYSPFTLQPRNDIEQEALRAWITTHQSMFLTIGAASSALGLGIELLGASEFDRAEHFLDLASKLRRASACYTNLKTVERGIYESFLRPAMIGVRPSFSGVSSKESIEFCILIKRLREMTFGHLPDRTERAKRGVLESDRIWWQMHVGAMQRMVGNPVSLAQSEFKRMAKEEGLISSYSEFLATTLQNPEAMEDYDRFFACVRTLMSYDDYVEELKGTLEISDAYISVEEPFGSFRAGLTEAIPELSDLATALGRSPIYAAHAHNS